MSIAPPAMPDDPLWQRISASPIGPAETALTFAAKLARENGWTAPYAARVIEEYRRFCYLGMTAGHEVTPSDAVDQCWHLHLTYTRDYWERFCPEVLGCAFHHGPTAGGPIELGRHFGRYAATLRSYETTFSSPPPDIWPPAQVTLLTAARARRVNPAEVIVIPRRALPAIGLILGMIALILAVWVVLRMG
jgi:hypothetical protein